MHVGRLSNPVGVTISPCTALPGVRGVAANPGLWNVTPSAYVPLVISFDHAITVHRVHRSDPSGIPVGRIACTVCMPDQLGMHRPITSTSNWFFRRRRYIPKPRVAAPAAHPGFTMPRGIQTPTGFYKRGMPAYRSFARHEYRHARRPIVQPRWGNRIAVHSYPGYAARPRTPGYGM